MTVVEDSRRARHYRDNGYTYKDIAAILGCSEAWVYALVNDEARERLNEKSAQRLSSGVCPDCGGRMTRPEHGVYTVGKPYERCIACHEEKVSADSFAHRVQGDTLRCRSCHERKPFSAYPQRMLRRFLERQRGKAPECTACGTAARTAYRNRHRVPCVECGAPRTGDGKRKESRGIDTGLCRDCYAGRTAAA